MTANRIVVGIDGSEISKEALRWAVDEARFRGAAIEVVHAWHFPLGFAAFGADGLPAMTIDELRKAADAEVQEVIADVVGADLTVPITATVRMGHAGVVLCDVARDATLLVVGSRGHGDITGLLLGSVSHHVVHHAPCPVVVLRRSHDEVSHEDRK